MVALMLGGDGKKELTSDQSEICYFLDIIHAAQERAPIFKGELRVARRNPRTPEEAKYEAHIDDRSQLAVPDRRRSLKAPTPNPWPSMP
jgi:hypothetical protein